MSSNNAADLGPFARTSRTNRIQVGPAVGCGLLAGLLMVAACEPTDDEPVGGVNNNNSTPACPNTLPQAFVSCAEPTCTATAAPRTYARAELNSDTANEWLVISHAGSDLFVNQTLNLTYALETVGGLTAAGDPSSSSAPRLTRVERLRRAFGEKVFMAIARQRRRVAAERRLRAESVSGPLSLQGITGTAIRGRPGAAGGGANGAAPPIRPQQMGGCSASGPSCGPDALCVIPQGETDGLCESALTLRFRGLTGAEDVAATVRAVGEFGAIVVDDADATALSDQDVNTLLDRFEQRIAPFDHQFFGLPQDGQGRDRDGNGVVILFVTSRVAQIDPTIVGFFQSTDLRPTSEAPDSNAADLLYLQPPGPGISLDQLSGTIAHEYQHLINYYAKVINRGSDPEEVWLDEGLSTFAEDATGYGADAFTNIAAYLVSVAETSLTGNGPNLPSEADSIERRGAVHLLVRYLFEQAGGASYGLAPDALTDTGGIAAVRDLVQRPDTGLDAFQETGRSFADWVQDLLTTIAIDGAGIPNASCNPNFTFAPPQIDAFTGFQRGIDLRTPITLPGGGSIDLNGPTTLLLRAEEVPVALNGGEIRTLSTPTGRIRVRLTADVFTDIELGLRIIPIRD